MNSEIKLDQAEVLAYSRSETDNLLRMYAEYQDLGEKIKNGKKATFSLLFGGAGKMQPDLKQKQENLGQRMKFQNPLIWMMYKHEAYKNNPTDVKDVQSPILTLSAMREHVKSEKDICNKRYAYINAALRQKNQGEDLSNDEFLPADTDLAEVIKDQRFVNLALDQSFMDGWLANENDEDGKWANYVKP